MAQAGVAMPVWSVRLIAELDAADEKARQVTGGLNAERLNWHPAPGAWSIGQCLEHLCITNDAYLPAMSAALSDNPAAAVQEITPGWFARWFIGNYVETSSRIKPVRAPKKIVPGVHVDASVLDRFLGSNRGVRELITRAREHDVNRIRFANPFVPVVRFTIGTGLEIVSRHEHRHLLQAERVSRSPEFPRS